MRIVFHATESTYKSGYANPIYDKQLFGTQRVLWKRKNLQAPLGVEPGSDISIPFIVQLPLVQFPPSANVISESAILSYHSNFTLSVYLDQYQGECIIKTHKTIIYMPFIETNLYKKPFSITTTYDKPSTSTIQYTLSSSNSVLDQSYPSIDLSTSSLDYVLGDAIPITLSFKCIPRKSVDAISVKLFQLQTWNKTSNSQNGKIGKSSLQQKELIAQTNITPPAAEMDISECRQQQEFLCRALLEIPHDALPTFTYSPVFSITYVLSISVKRKGKFWSNKFSLNDVPIKIGTLGYGVRSSEEIQLYSTFNSVFDQPSHADQGSTDLSTTARGILPVPRFLDVIEYEESPPVYVKDRPPSYDTIVNTPQYSKCILDGPQT